MHAQQNIELHYLRPGNSDCRRERCTASVRCPWHGLGSTQSSSPPKHREIRRKTPEMWQSRHQQTGVHKRPQASCHSSVNLATKQDALRHQDQCNTNRPVPQALHLLAVHAIIDVEQRQECSCEKKEWNEDRNKTWNFPSWNRRPNRRWLQTTA